MKILVTNDDGIHSEGLWILVRELKNVGQVTVVTPDREQSGIGTAVSLRQPLTTQKVKPPVPGVEAYSVDGTPSDSVLLALGKLTGDRTSMVVSGINDGWNLGEDVHISGTIGAALQGYLRGYPTLAVSAPYGNEPGRNIAAGVAGELAGRMAAAPLPEKIFLNINVPELPLSKIAGVKITKLARGSHINTVEEGNRGRLKYYWLVRERLAEAGNEGTDIWAVERGYISVTPLYFTHADKPPQHLLQSLCADLLQEVKNKQN